MTPNEASRSFLLFRLGDEIYGTPAIDVTEITQDAALNPVPNTVPSFLGLFNFHGRIAGTINLAKHLEVKQSKESHELFLVFETEEVVLACSIDEVLAIEEFRTVEVESEPNLDLPIPPQYLIGLTRFGGDVVTLLNVKKMLHSESLVNLENSRLEA